VPELIRSAVTNIGQEQTDVIAGAEVSAIVELADLGGLEFAWVGLRVVGPVDPNFTAVLLAEVPGVSRDEWSVDGNGMPHRDVRAGEVVWSALIDISAV
jgi:hypothetical protein